MKKNLWCVPFLKIVVYSSCLGWVTEAWIVRWGFGVGRIPTGRLGVYKDLSTVMYTWLKKQRLARKYALAGC